MIAWHVKEKAVKKAKVNKDVNMRETRDGLIFCAKNRESEENEKDG